jgi:hypothetical protein
MMAALLQAALVKAARQSNAKGPTETLRTNR